VWVDIRNVGGDWEEATSRCGDFNGLTLAIRTAKVLDKNGGT